MNHIIKTNSVVDYLKSINLELAAHALKSTSEGKEFIEVSQLDMLSQELRNKVLSNVTSQIIESYYSPN